MSEQVDRIHFLELAELDPEDVCRRTLCDFDPGKRCYTLIVFKEEYEIYPFSSEIKRVCDGSTNINIFFGLFLVWYLLKAKETPVKGEWISEKDLPGGPTFFRGPHTIPTLLIENRYGKHIDDFKKQCEQMGGTPIDMADAAFVFNMAPRVPVAVLLWEGDDEFPAQAKMLFDKSIMEHMALDVIFSLTLEMCERISNNQWDVYSYSSQTGQS